MNEREDSISADTVAPFARSIACEAFAESTRIGTAFEMGFHPIKQKPRIEPVHLLELFPSRGGELNSVARAVG
ncbi:hypothetical protein HMPREF2559_12220 [Corynebacterium sp. HMSC072G08]|nr:hypothetical protein HMPREF2559_12220 [Corynebacterium sp. HMSC072G08]